jgi:hypothetical protein
MPKPITLADLPEDLARYDAKMATLRTAIAEGDASPDFEGNPFASVRAELGLPIRKETTA